MSNSTTSAVTSDSSSVQSATSSLDSAISSSVAAAVSSSILSSKGDSTTTVEPSTANVVTSIVSASAAPTTTNIITSVVTDTSVSNGITGSAVVTVVVTSVDDPSTTIVATAAATSDSSSAAAAASSSAAALQNDGSGSSSSSSSGLSAGGKTAIAVVIPVAFVALLVGLGIWLWRRRKQKKDNREQLQKDMADYGYNPNNDPTLPSVASDSGAPQMAEDSSSGYRGWGAAAGSASNRKASTTLSGGHTQGQLSDSGNSYGHSPGSPGAQYSDGHSGDVLVDQRNTMGSDDLAALGAGPAAGTGAAGVRRGPSNASSAYSAGARSEGSDEPIPQVPNSYQGGNGFGYGQHGPYGDGSYGGGAQDNGGMPIVRDVSARRNTRIQQGGNYPANSGIAANF